MAMGQISGFSIGFRRRPYNTLALQVPCECVIIIMKMYIVQKYTEKMINKNTHEMNELGLLGTHELYHKINVFTVKAI